MIISRTPFRISFFGGGTDFPEWYNEHGGTVLATTIDKYCYLSTRYMPPFFEHKYRIIWSKIEICQNVEEIEHPAVKAGIKHLQLEDRCLEIHHLGDLPARSGMGSSSAFTVGMLNSLAALRGKMMTKYELATQAIQIEQEILREAVGSQDQVCAAYGGFNHISFYQNGEISVVPITLSRQKIKELQSHLLLFYTGIARTSSDVVQSFSGKLDSKRRQLRIMKDIVDEAISILNGDQDIMGFGHLLREAWEVKRTFSGSISNPQVDNMMETALRAGALGGKLTGAGGGGFLLLFVPPECRSSVKTALKHLLHVPFEFENSGSQIIFADHDADYSSEEDMRKMQPIAPFGELQQLIQQIPAQFK